MIAATRSLSFLVERVLAAMPAKLFQLQLGLLFFLVACCRVVTPGALGTRQRNDVAHFSLLRTQIAYSSTTKRKPPLGGSGKAEFSIRNCSWKNSWWKNQKLSDFHGEGAFEGGCNTLTFAAKAVYLTAVSARTV